MSIGSGEAKESSTKQAREALQVFSVIQPKDKLRYHKTTGLFEIDRDGNNFSRTFDNFFRKKGTENSVTNDEMFHRPIINVFNLSRHSVPKDEMERAFNGLCNLKKTYEKDQTKLESLNKTLAQVRKLIDDPVRMSPESLSNISNALSKKADAVFVDYAREDGDLLSSAIIQQMSQVDQASLRVIFGAVRNDRTRLGKELKTVGDTLDFYSNKNNIHTLDLGRISDLIYIVLQQVEIAHIQNHFDAGYNNWLAKIRDKVRTRMFSTYFQTLSSVNVNSNDADHPSDDFLWFRRSPKVDIAKVSRLYFCPANMHDIDKFIDVAGGILNPPAINFMFKIDYRKNMVFKRRDAIVLYYEGNLEAGRNLAVKFKAMLRAGYFKQNFGPFGATSVSNDNDVFWQAEPGLFDTGLDKDEDPRHKTQKYDREGHKIGRLHSATSIRAELITMALLRWKTEFSYQVAKCAESGLPEPTLTNELVYADEFDRFERYVANAFHGYKQLLSPE